MLWNAAAHCGRVYREKVRATKKNELMENVLVRR
jgi:hypothetical protein